MIQNENGIWEWKYHTSQTKEDVYQSIIDKINIISCEEFNQLDEIAQMKYVNQILAAIRELNVFPVYYYNEEGIAEEIRSVRDKTVRFEDDKLATQSYQGTTLLDFLFPNLHLAEAGNANNNNVYSRFYDDDKMRRILKAYLAQHDIVNMRTVFFTYGRMFWNTAINFAPIRAKSIYERFCPKNGVILDYSSGYGGRMLGALASRNNYTYYGIEPNSNTFHNLNRLGSYIQSTFHESAARYKLFQTGSEDFCDESIKADFIFSCPPFFALERYSEEETQSTVKYPQYSMWLKYYARPTIANCRKMIKDDGLFGIDILDFYWKNKKYNLVRDWIKIIEEEGFKFVGKFSIVSRARKLDKEDNTEFVYIFKPLLAGETSDSFYGDAASYADNEPNAPIPESIGIYDRLGMLIDVKDSVSEIVNAYNDCSDSSVRSAIKSGKIYKNRFFRLFKIDENPAQSIELDYLCEIDGIRFFKQVEVASYLGQSRQTVSAAVKRHAQKIAGRPVIWAEDQKDLTK